MSKRRSKGRWWCNLDPQWTASTIYRAKDKDYAEQEAVYSKKKKDKKDKWVLSSTMTLKREFRLTHWFQEEAQTQGHWLLHGKLAESVLHEGEWHGQGHSPQGQEGQEVQAHLQQFTQWLRLGQKAEAQERG